MNIESFFVTSIILNLLTVFFIIFLIKRKTAQQKIANFFFFKEMSFDITKEQYEEIVMFCRKTLIKKHDFVEVKKEKRPINEFDSLSFYKKSKYYQFGKMAVNVDAGKLTVLLDDGFGFYKAFDDLFTFLRTSKIDNSSRKIPNSHK